MERDAESQPLCGKCGVRPRVPRQRWCHDCRAKYMRENYRPRARERLTKMREIERKTKRKVESMHV